MPASSLNTNITPKNVGYIEHINWEKQYSRWNSESFKINGNITNDKKIISNKFCEFFSEIGNKYASNIPPARKPFYRHLQNNHNARSMFMSPTDEVEVCNIITSMKAKNSSGHDFISSKFIKSIQNSICKPLSIIFK